MFARTGRAVRLTPAGRTLLAHARTALAELAAAAEELSGDADVVLTWRVVARAPDALAH